MHKFNETLLFTHLSALGVKPGMNLLLHSGIYAFGEYKGGLDAIFESLINYMGPESTIVVPTFTLWKDENTIYTADLPSQKMGLLAEYIRKNPRAVRSRCPMHNHAAIGPLSEKLHQFSGEYSTGANSDFDLFLEDSFYNLFLGCQPHESGTYLIHLESVAQVPYREWIIKKEKVLWDTPDVVTVDCHYFGRKKLNLHYLEDAVGVKVNLSILQDLLLENKIFTTDALPLGRSYLAPMKAMHDCVVSALADNPYLLLTEQA